MQRLHLFEFEDLPWFPDRIRTAMTDYLSFVGNVTALPYGVFVAKLAAAMQATGDRQLVDLCSGGSGPVLRISQMLREEHDLPVEVMLTDLYPNVERLEYAKQRAGGHIDYRSDPVDATAVPEELTGFRLITNGFHHFPPELARSILQDAARQSRGIAIFELVSRSPQGFVTVLGAPLGVLAFTPFIRPFRWDRLAMTYLAPIVPAFVFFDGMVSCLRVYSPMELQELVDGIPEAKNLSWDIGTTPVPGGPAYVTYLIGTPAT